MKSFESLLATLPRPPSPTGRDIRRRTGHDRLAGTALPPLLQRIYAARGCDTVEDLALAAERLIPVASLENTGAAAALLAAHRERRILVVGDFDADGATSTALMLRALRHFGFAHVDFLVPNRFEFGYGLTPQIVELAATRMPTLLVFGDADAVLTAHAVEFFELLGGGKKDGGWDGSGISTARLAILPGATHYTIFASPALVAAVVPFLDTPMPK